MKQENYMYFAMRNTNTKASLLSFDLIQLRVRGDLRLMGVFVEDKH